MSENAADAGRTETRKKVMTAMLVGLITREGDAEYKRARAKAEELLEAYHASAALRLEGAPGTTDLPYEAVSVNGRAMEWKAPLWDAIQKWADGRPASPRREEAVAEVERAVESAMRLVLELAPLAASQVAPGANSKCPRCGFVTADVFNCPTCKAGA